MELTPLEDPDYVPKHPPEAGQIPEVVAQWGKRSQLRWFRRFRDELYPRQAWEKYWCESEHHRGTCCGSCEWELREGTGVKMDGWCCCRDPRVPPRGAS